jgi:hypothetical protein
MRTLTCLVLLATLPVAASARPGYLSKREMIGRAEVVALVEVTRVEPLPFSTELGPYTQRAEAVVEHAYKGVVPHDIILWGVRTPEAEIRFAPGRYLVFLRRDGEKLLGVNWHLSARPVEGGWVEWYAGDRWYKMKRARLKSVLEEIKSIIASKANTAGANPQRHPPDMQQRSPEHQSLQPGSPRAVIGI